MVCFFPKLSVRIMSLFITRAWLEKRQSLRKYFRKRSKLNSRCSLVQSIDPLDPLPASVLKTCFPIILPTLTSIINMSLKNGVMPCALKVVVLKPLLKKQDADFEQLQNFRLISILIFVSKLIEKAVALQLNDHILRHHLDETFQSAYKAFHSTETALVRVHNDILTAIDKITLLFYFYSTYLLPLTL